MGAGFLSGSCIWWLFRRSRLVTSWWKSVGDQKEITDLSLLGGGFVPWDQGFSGDRCLRVGTARKGFSLWQKSVIDRLVKVWAVSPVLSLAIAYGCVQGGVRGDFHSVIAVIKCVSGQHGE